jgi:hypothetical protein
VDRYFERYYARGPRRRPVRIEFCEADVLDVFDEWRRAVGIPAVEPTNGDSSDGTGTTTAGSLPSHLERVIARLTALRAGEDRSLDRALDDVVRELDSARATARHVRGAARDAFLQRLAVLDRALIDAARAQCDAAVLRQLAVDAEAELAPFRERMPADAYARSLEACIDRAIRERLRLPVVTFD